MAAHPQCTAITDSLFSVIDPLLMRALYLISLYFSDEFARVIFRVATTRYDRKRDERATMMFLWRRNRAASREAARIAHG